MTDHAYCTCAKPGCTNKIKYPIARGTTRSIYCPEHEEEMIGLLMRNEKIDRSSATKKLHVPVHYSIPTTQANLIPVTTRKAGAKKYGKFN